MAQHGGGMFNLSGSSPSLVNVTFYANQASYNDENGDGGGMYNNGGSPYLVNVSFSGNQAHTSGGGIYNYDSSLTIINSTISGNRAINGGGMYNNECNPTVRNTILWGNIASSEAQIFNTLSSKPIVQYSDVDGGCPPNSSCEHLIQENPLFVRSPSPGPDLDWGTSDDDFGDLHLQSNSPAIDVANNTYLPVDAFDLDRDSDISERVPLDLGKTERFVDISWVSNGGVPDPPTYLNVADMGAYEARYTKLSLHQDVSASTRLPGETLNYTLAFSTTDQVSPSHIWISDTLPAELQVLDYQVSPGLHVTPTGAFSYTWQINDLAPNTRGVITISAVVASGLHSGYVFTNTAEINADIGDPDPTDNRSKTAVTILNAAPEANNDQGNSFTGNEDNPLKTGDVRSNDSELNGESLSLTSYRDTDLIGLLTSNGDGTFNYNPNGQFEALGVGEQSFQTFVYTVTDGLLSDSAVVTITVNGVNDTPIAVNDGELSVWKASNSNILNVLANDTDIESNDLQIFSVGTPNHGGTASNNHTNILYTPATGFTGVEVFTYTVSDGHGGFDTGLVTVTVYARIFLPVVMHKPPLPLAR